MRPLLIAIFACIVSAAQAEDVPVIKIGPVTNKMTFEEVRRVVDGRVACHDDTTAKVTVEVRCVLVSFQPGSALLVAAEPNGRIFAIQRLLVIPAAMEWSSAFRQAVGNYSALGVPLASTGPSSAYAYSAPFQESEINRVDGLVWSFGRAAQLLKIYSNASLPRDAELIPKPPAEFQDARLMAVEYVDKQIEETNKSRIEDERRRKLDESSRRKLDW